MIRTYYLMTPVWLVLSLLALVYLVLRSSKEMKSKLLLCGAFSILLILNEFSYRFLIKIFNQASYYRFLWVVPYAFLIAWGLARLVFDIRDGFGESNGSFSGREKRQRLLAAVMIPLAFFCMLGTTLGNYESRLKNNYPQNEYLVEDDILEVKELMQKERQEGYAPKIPVMAYPREFALQYQTCDAACITVTHREIYLNGFDYSQPETASPACLLAAVCTDNVLLDVKLIRRALEELQVEYMVVHANAGMEDYMEQLDCTLAGQTTTCLLYRVNRD